MAIHDMLYFLGPSRTIFSKNVNFKTYTIILEKKKQCMNTSFIIRNICDLLSIQWFWVGFYKYITSVIAHIYKGGYYPVLD